MDERLEAYRRGALASADEWLNAYRLARDQGDEAAAQQVLDRVDRDEREKLRRLSSPGALAGAARWYAQCGMAVFPLRPHGKEPLPGTHGFKDATVDIDQINEWWAASPSANIGAPTGLRFDVVDIDAPTGYASMVMLQDEGALPEPLAVVHTGGGGMHWYVPPTGRGNRAAIRPGVDYRGLGGYVVVPPSVTDGLYSWGEQPAFLKASG